MNNLIISQEVTGKRLSFLREILNHLEFDIVSKVAEDVGKHEKQIIKTMKEQNEIINISSECFNFQQYSDCVSFLLVAYAFVEMNDCNDKSISQIKRIVEKRRIQPTIEKNWSQNG